MKNNLKFKQSVHHHCCCCCSVVEPQVQNVIANNVIEGIAGYQGFW
jgi:hypothetical protein